MKRIFAFILIVLLLSVLFVACDTTAPPANTTPGVTITASPSPTGAINSPATSPATGDNRAGTGNNVNKGNNANNAINRALTTGRKAVETPVNRNTTAQNR